MAFLKKINKIGLGIFALSFLLLTSCELEPSDKIDPTTSSELSSQDNGKIILPDYLLLHENFGRINGSNSNQRLDPESTPQIESEDYKNFREMVRQAMEAVEPSPCGPTDFNYWINNELEGWDEPALFGFTVYQLASFIGMLDFPTYDALLFENSSEDQYFGLDGEHTQVLTKTFKDLKRFWDIPSEDIVLAAMHGNMLLDREKVIRIDKILYNDDQANAELYADLIIFLFENFSQYRNGEHPIFTFNAFAQTSFEFGGNLIPSKIIMGDGILDAYTGLGFEDVAPQAILAHEYGHQIQYAVGTFDNPISSDRAENTRRTEMMADAFSAYYLSHARGATMQWKRVQQFLEVFFNIGDCGFSNSGHHGTPLQRMAAAQWGYDLANSAKKQGEILSSQEFADLFDAALPSLVGS
ncbi:hypothetical protein [Algoriphagus machipongonensis]|uniref:Lipoprotein n=1 Tax=Algoriphagus machipongonensis TaxID=388413 RepID=A3HT03_9BACT|nr:hypothetical protein [Algoriphagus machipongonensis]EAZ82971.1 hypothetical protein ALPR1_12160 [Algoriphagus machipongonensis]